MQETTYQRLKRLAARARKIADSLERRADNAFRDGTSWETNQLDQRTHLAYVRFDVLNDMAHLEGVRERFLARTANRNTIIRSAYLG